MGVQKKTHNNLLHKKEGGGGARVTGTSGNRLKNTSKVSVYDRLCKGKHLDVLTFRCEQRSENNIAHTSGLTTGTQKMQNMNIK